MISVDTKEKEKRGSFKNGGSEYSVKKKPGKALDHDFPLRDWGKSHHTVNNNVGISHDTSEFALESILRWREETLGNHTFSNGKNGT